jgi:hypothetical protein
MSRKKHVSEPPPTALLKKIGRRRGYLVGIDPGEIVRLLGAEAVDVALEE